MHRLTHLFGVAALLATTVLFTLGPSSAEAVSCSIDTPSDDYHSAVEGSAKTAQIWRLYQAYFLRQPDEAGLEYWLDVAESGVSLQDLSYNFEQAEEFTARYGEVDHDDFIELIYQNVMCRQPDGGGFEYWLELLEAGVIGRGELMVLFSESDEFVEETDTGWSIFDDADEANFEEDGYMVKGIDGGLIIKVDYRRVDFRASHERCSVASINGNWFYNPEQPNPTPIGFAVIDGQHVPGSVNTGDRGVFGERFRPNGPAEELVWEYEGVFKLSSNLKQKGDFVLENWRSWQPESTPQLDNPEEWRWAAAGIPLIVNGQVWESFYNIPTNDYTHYTTGHSFVAFDKHSGVLVFGSTVGMTSAELIEWAQEHGYDDLIKFDGGGSVELNINGERRVAGTNRDVPVWLGIGC